MGGWDAYCALCGALASVPGILDDDQNVETEGTYDRAVATDEAMAWMDDVRLIGQNDECELPSKVFITGKAHHHDGFFTLDKCDDPHFFPEGHNSHTFLQAYAPKENENHPVAIPFHDLCYDLLRRQVGVEKLDLDVLYQVFEQLRPLHYQAHLTLDYGEISKYQEQYWPTYRGTEAFVIDPQSIPWLQQYYGRLPEREPPQQDDLITPSTTRAPGNDIIALLPPELLLQIMSHLDIISSLSFRAASKAAHNLELDQAFWRGRIRLDMPWLYDFPFSSAVGSSDSIDFCRAYKDLLLASSFKSAAKVHGLSNRRRIWEIIQQITDLYFIGKGRHSGRSLLSLPNIKSTAMVRLIHPEPSSLESFTLPLIEIDAQLSPVSITISAHWNKAGNLSGLTTRLYSEGKEISHHTVGNSMNFATTGECIVPPEDWLAAVIIRSKGPQSSQEGPDDGQPASRVHVVGVSFVFASKKTAHFGSPDGDCRLICVDHDSFVAGISVQWSSTNGQVSRLALLQQPLPYGQKRIQNASLTKVRRRLTTHPYLWKGELPPSALQMTETFSGYWSSKMKYELSPLECLIFGLDDSSLSDVTAIGGDATMGGFEVHYASRQPTSIGPRHHQMQYLQIEGAGGERIVAIHLSVEHVILAIRLVTNRGRQLIIGVPSDRENSFTGIKMADSASVVAGIYCNWSKYATPTSRLEHIGFAGRITGDPDTVDTTREILERSSNAPPRDNWIPSPPPPTIQPRGRLWGKHEARDLMRQQTSQYPSPKSILYWLDCRRTLSAVKATMCHGLHKDRLPMTALMFEYADERLPRTNGVGPSEFHSPTDTEGRNGHPWCWCAYGDKRDEEMQARPHLVQESYDIGDAKLREVRIWLDENEGLSGMQFVAENRKEGPKWGYRTESEPTGSITFDTGQLGDGTPVGLKFFLHYIDRHVTYDDLVVLGVQLLVDGA